MLLIPLLLTLAGCKESIIHNLNELEANRVLTRLHDISITGEKIRQADGKWSLEVESSEALRAIKYLSDARVFKDAAHADLEKSNLMSSREDQHYRHERLLSQEIESTLASIDGVLDARVHLNLPETDPILGHKLSNAHGSGSVLLIVQDEFKNQSQTIARLVAGASGLEEKDIAVLLSREGVVREPLQVNAVNSPSSLPEPPLGAAQKVSLWSQYFAFNSYKQIGLWIFASFLFVTGLVVLIIGKRGRKSLLLQKEAGGSDLYDLARDLH